MGAITILQSVHICAHIILVGSLEVNPLAVKLLDNRLYMFIIELKNLLVTPTIENRCSLVGVTTISQLIEE